jgi:hypothetical protein
MEITGSKQQRSEHSVRASLDKCYAILQGCGWTLLEKSD